MISIKKDMGLKDVQSWKVKIYTIGKDANGESNLFLFLVDDQVKYSIVIDSCEKDIKILKDIIEGEYGIKAFDIICWTHPHLDHSKGLLSLLKNYSNEETKIVLPAELHIVKDCMKTESRNIFDYIQKITKRNSIKHGECNVVTEGKILEYFELRGKEKIVFRIISLSPISTRVLNMANICKQKTAGKCSHNFNEYSVALIVEINGYWFLFAGDIENSTIAEIAKKYLLDNVVFVKIPHHGSDTSNKLVELFDKKTCKDMVCATTALIKKGEFNKLPNNDVKKFEDKYLVNYLQLEFTKCFRINEELAEKLGRIWKKKIIGVNENCNVEIMSVDEVVDFLEEQDPKDILCLGSRYGAMTRVLNELEENFPEKYNKNSVYASIANKDL